MNDVLGRKLRINRGCRGLLLMAAAPRRAENRNNVVALLLVVTIVAPPAIAINLEIKQTNWWLFTRLYSGLRIVHLIFEQLFYQTL